MKIAIINRHPEDVVGGSEIQCDNLAMGLAERGHDIAFIAPHGRKGHNYNRNYRVIPVEPNGNSIAKAVVDFAPDIAYWRFNKYYFLRSLKPIADKKIPIIFAGSHISDMVWWSSRENPFKGIKPFLKSIKQGLVNMWNHQAYKYVDGITLNNPDHMNMVPVKHQKLILDGVHLDSVPFSWPRPYVVWIANLKPHKQPEKYVNLARHFSDSGVDFLMVGDIQDPEFEWIRSEHSKLPNFHYLGRKTPQEANGIIASSLALIHTCKPEGFCNVLVQAWLMKKPTVSLAFDPGSYIKDNKLGGYAAGDWNVFTAQLDRLLKDDSERTAAGQRAYDFSVPAFSMEKTIADNENFAMEILTRKKA